MNASLISVNRLTAGCQRVPPESVAQRPLRDRLERPLLDLRISVTDRCNFRCVYCMPRDKAGHFVPRDRDGILSYEEIMQVARAFLDLGVQKLRITGGEPLVRRDLSRLIRMLAGLGVEDLCLTTNGSLLVDQAQALADAGLRRITVSLDALDDVTFRRMTDSNTSVARVLAGIDAARRHGLRPIKINMVVQRNVNEHAVLPMARWARREGLEVRFIEYMDVGCSNGWRPEQVVTAAEIRARIEAVFPMAALSHGRENQPAERFRYLDGNGSLGIIASVSRPFCSSCTRARLSSEGVLYPCLFAPHGLALAAPLRSGRDLLPFIVDWWHHRADRYSELRSEIPTNWQRPEMSAIGG